MRAPVAAILRPQVLTVPSFFFGRTAWTPAGARLGPPYEPAILAKKRFRTVGIMEALMMPTAFSFLARRESMSSMARLAFRLSMAREISQMTPL